MGENENVMLEKDQGVLFYCYKCEVNTVRIEDRNGKPAFQCPKCLDVAQFDFSILTPQSSVTKKN